MSSSSSSSLTSTAAGKKGISERELQRKEEQLAKTYGYEADLPHHEDSVIQKEAVQKGSFKEFITSISNSERGRKKRKPNVTCRSPAKTLDTADPVTPMEK